MYVLLIVYCFEISNHEEGKECNTVNKINKYIYSMEHSHFFENLKFPQVIKKSSACYGIRMFITKSTKAHSFSTTWARSMQSTPILFLENIFFKLPAHVLADLPSNFFHSGFPIKICMHFSSIPYTPRAQPIWSPWFGHVSNKEYKIPNFFLSTYWSSSLLASRKFPGYWIAGHS